MFKWKCSEFLFLYFQFPVIYFIAYDEELNIFFCIFFDLIQPELLDVLQGFAYTKIEDEDDTLSAFIIGTGYGTETFLTSSVPNLQLHWGVIEFDCSTLGMGYLNLKSTPMVAR